MTLLQNCKELFKRLFKVYTNIQRFFLAIYGTDYDVWEKNLCYGSIGQYDNYKFIYIYGNAR